MLKKRFVLLVIIALVISTLGPAVATASTAPIKVVVNGKQLTLEVAPIMQNARVLVPFRAIFDALGATSEWDAANNLVTGRLGRKLVVAQLEKKTAWLNGEPVQLDVAATVRNGRTLVPVRVVSEGLGAAVAWNEATRTVTVTAAQATTPVLGGTLTRAVNIDADTLNPLFTSNNVSAWITSLTHLGLVRLDENQEPINALAERWQWNESTFTYRFWLAKGVKWHDGQPFTAQDVKFTFDTIANPGSFNLRKGDFTALQSVTVIDDFTVDITLTREDAPFLSRMTMGIIPKHILGSVPLAEMANHAYSSTPIGTGPFKVNKWTRGQNIALDANKDFHLGAPYLDKMLIKVIYDSDSMALAWENGELDWNTSLPSASASRLMKEYDDKAYFKEVSKLEYEFVRPNMANPILQDVKVRQALMYAVDRPAMIDSLLDGRAKIMNGHQLPSSWAYTTGLNPYTKDTAKAIQLLVDAGWKTVGNDGIRTNAQGQKLSFTLLINAPHPLRADMAAFLQDAWKQIGVELKIQAINFGVLMGAHLNQSKFDLVLIGPGMQPDPDPFHYLHSSQGLVNGRMVGRNNGNWKKSEYDGIMEDARVTSDQAQRRALYQRLEKLFNNDLPFLPMFTITDVHGIYNKVQGIVWGLNGPVFPELVYKTK